MRRCSGQCAAEWRYNRINDMAKAKETLTTRVERLEKLHADLAEKMAALVNAQIQNEKKVSERFEEVGRRFEEQGERVDKLVVAIGELISRMPPESLRPHS